MENSLLPERSSHKRYDISVPSQDIDKTIWVSQETKTRNHIDHITVVRRWRKSMTDIRAYRGADIASDHQLVVAKFKIKAGIQVMVT